MGVKVIIKENGKILKEIIVDGEKVKKVDAGTNGKDFLTSGGPSSFPVVMFHSGKFYFALPPNLFKGKVTKKDKEVSIEQLIESGFGKESQGLIWGIIDNNTIVELFDNNRKILIGDEKSLQSSEANKNKVEEKKEVLKKKKEESKPAVGGIAFAGAGGPVLESFDFHNMRRRSLHVYLGILSFFVIAAVVMMAILGSMELPPQNNDITAIPARFAKLIVKHVPKPEKKEKVKGTGEEEKKKNQTQQKMEETNKQEKAATGNMSEQARRAALQRKVRHVGVLAILTSKGGQGLVQDVVSAAGNIGDLDSVLSKMGGVETAKAGMDIAAIKKTRMGGAVASADIGSLGVGPGQKVSLGSKKIRRVRASINLGGGRISGSLAGEVIRRVVKMNIRGIKYCYEKELKSNPKLSGKIVVLFTIGTTGRVMRARIQSTTMHNENVESCILRMISRWRFPRPEKGSVTVSYPFIFTPGS